VPARFRNSKAVGAGVWTDTLQVSHPARRATAQLSRCGDEIDADDASTSGPEHAGAFGEMVLAQGLGDEDCQASRDKKAIVALARRLAVIMHRIWVDGSEFR